MRRLLLLGLTLSVGGAVGWTGLALSGSTAWLLALPVSLVGVWLVVADPTRCQRPPGGRAAGFHPTSTPHTTPRTAPDGDES